jgi:hypothetical protein
VGEYIHEFSFPGNQDGTAESQHGHEAEPALQ